MRPGNGAATSGWSSPLASRMLASSACSAPKTCTCYYHDHVAEEGRGMRHAACEHLLQQHVCGNTISCGMGHASTCCSNMYVAIQYHVACGTRAPAAAIVARRVAMTSSLSPLLAFHTVCISWCHCKNWQFFFFSFCCCHSP